MGELRQSHKGSSTIADRDKYKVLKIGLGVGEATVEKELLRAIKERTTNAYTREDIELLLQALEETENALLQTEKKVHMLRTFKLQAELIMPNFQFEHISNATVRYLLQEQFKKTDVEDVQL